MYNLPKFMFWNNVARAPEGGGDGGSATPPATPSADGGGHSSSAPSTTSSGSPSAPSAPSAAPSGATSPAPSTPPTSDASAFDGLGGDGFDDVDIDGNETANPVPAAPAAPTPPAATPPAQAQPAAPGQAQPAAPAQPAQQPGPQDQTPSLSLADPGKIAEHMAANMDMLVTEVSNRLFRLSDEDIAALETDAPALLPKMMAKVYLAATENFMRQAQQMIPAMLSRHNEVSSRREQNAAKFYAKWKDQGITKEAHGQLVDKAAAVLRQMNPKMTLDQMIEAVGPIVIQQAGIKPPAPTTLPSTRKPTSPFVPAGVSTAGAAPQTTQADPWGGLDPAVEHPETT